MWQDIKGIFWGFMVIAFICLSIRYWVVVVPLTGGILVPFGVVALVKRERRLARMPGQDPVVAFQPAPENWEAAPEDLEVLELERQVRDARNRNEAVLAMQEQSRLQQARVEQLRAELERLDKEFNER